MHPIGDIWSGMWIFPPDQHDTVLELITEFVQNNKDPRASLLPCFSKNLKQMPPEAKHMTVSRSRTEFSVAAC